MGSRPAGTERDALEPTGGGYYTVPFGSVTAGRDSALERCVVKLRLKRFGRRHRPFYRLNAMDQRAARDSQVIEQLGFYDPIEKDTAKAVKLNEDRIKYWLSVGAQPSDTVRSLLKKAGIDPTPGKRQ
ncbi:MAG: 30S ribosomal protein S16 [Phycisphaeraceae bacterium]